MVCCYFLLSIIIIVIIIPPCPPPKLTFTLRAVHVRGADVASIVKELMLAKKKRERERQEVKPERKREWKGML